MFDISMQVWTMKTKTNTVLVVQEAPVLGAWGLGWEVWCDGQEISQFTYFQQAGGQPLSHPAIEITYGLERILMALQVANLLSLCTVIALQAVNSFASARTLPPYLFS